MGDQIVPISLGVAIAIFLVFAFVFAKRARASEEKVSRSLCLNCGYDLRASRDRCPECGAKAFHPLDAVKLAKPPTIHEQWPAEADKFDEVLDKDLTAIVHQTIDKREAFLVVQQLESRHIPAREKGTELKGQAFFVLHNVFVCEHQKTLAESIISKFAAD